MKRGGSKGRKRNNSGKPCALSMEQQRDFEELALPYLPSLYRVAMRLRADQQDAEDLVQDTYIKALQAFPSLREPEKVRPWLLQILSRAAIDRFRREPREVYVGDLEDLDGFSLYDKIRDEDPFPYSEQLHQDFLAQFRDEEVNRALRALPQEYRLPLVLFYVEELSYRELAEVLECPVGTIMSRLFRGRKMIERELWEYAKEKGLIKRWKL
jgi:RNA polymerase sigma-70 factor (ECF subfamily)